MYIFGRAIFIYSSSTLLISFENGEFSPVLQYVNMNIALPLNVAARPMILHLQLQLQFLSKHVVLLRT